MIDIKNWLTENKNKFEKYIADSRDLRSKGVPEQLFVATEYSLTAGGKRLRPILCIASAVSCGCREEKAMPLALGIEMFHTASLIHDDLPCMDNDTMRRGMLSNHAKFGETLAVLAGDALMLQAFEFPMRYTTGVEAKNLLRAMQIFSQATGPSGVCGGQVLDMDDSLFADSQDPEKIAALKTGALICAATTAGAVLGTGDEKTIKCFYDYGKHIGKAFQIIDDILDKVSTSEVLGKTVGKDEEQKKATFVSKFGLETAYNMAEELTQKAVEAIGTVLPNDNPLVLLPKYLLQRTK